MWVVFGNPTRNTGRFRDCFQADESRWTTRQIDSRTCKMTNKTEIAEWVDTYGEDSDFVRVRVKGQFPRTGTMQFISSELVDMAAAADVPYESYFLLPVILSCDVARYGDDKSIVALRQGRKILHMWKYRELNLMELASEVSSIAQEFEPDGLFVDGVAIGAGVVDRLEQLGHSVISVIGGKEAFDDELYFNKRAEMWGRMRGWLLDGADIPVDPDLRASMIGVEYGFDRRDRIQLERKKDMKDREGFSPDEADCIALGFAEIVVARRDRSYEPGDFMEPEDMYT